MTKRTKLKALLTGTLALMVLFSGCESNDPLSTQADSAFQQNQPKFLSFSNPDHTLGKQKKKAKWISKNNGGLIELDHGSAISSRGLMYMASSAFPYGIYQIDPADAANPVLVGNMAFQSRAIAVHPDNGKVYYASQNWEDGGYQIGIWDPETNSNTLLPGQSLSPGYKLTFAPDGTLYGVNRGDTDELYRVNTENGSWTFVLEFPKDLGNQADFAFGPDGKLYNFDNHGSRSTSLYVLDIESGSLIDKGLVSGINTFFGAAFGSDGMLYACHDDGELYRVDINTVQAIYVGDTNIDDTYDMASQHFEVELSFAEVSLQVLPNSIDVDKEIEITMETTELMGGVAVTFQPHGTVFSPDAILNLVAHGVDFSGINPNTVDIYYDNTETGQWELMSRDDIVIDVANGTVQVINARLPHFSRYGVAAD